ncbi:DNA polymerase/3'-5' exonuclease PolX [Nosocomiicoccus massiliensis]|uniref:DNA polymerase/3'-5' exonuclease PolX n=1 Tax=Nosocomiicoccus massiliensis TaxID=1232430 RepID=UPI000400A3DC|nr:DNA polymerase/3'-5' exonuclease PolX [Nosocomiicoccus massiliensis]
MTKRDIIRMLEEIATYLELNLENSFKVSAYRKAAAALEKDPRALSEIESFDGIKGIGKSTKEVIEEYLEKNQSTVLNELKERTPVGLTYMTKIPGLGAKRVAKIYEETGIDNLDDFEQFLRDGKLEQLPGFGKKTEENILNGLISLSDVKRHPISTVMTIQKNIESFLSSLNYVERFDIAGSARRFKETSGDIDFIVQLSDSHAFIKDIEDASFFKSFIAKGDKKVSIQYTEGLVNIQVDFRLVQGDEYYSTLQHFTGSKDHNVRMRQIAKSRNEKINEYGVESDGKILTFDSEEEFYKHFDLPYIPPAMRETGSEVDVNMNEIITLDDIKGDIHMHTTYSDGAYSIREMVEACIERGYEYIVITDHSKSLPVANGLSEERLLKQIEEIRKINEEYDEIDVYAGTEMDILSDGTLDYSDDILKSLDYVIASIHSNFNQTEEEIMHRLKCAMHNPYVRHIAHPTGRLIGRRDGYNVNMEELLQIAKDTRTVLEVNANPNRLDLSSDAIYGKDIMLTVNTDAHHIDHLAFMEYGIATLQKGQVNKKNVINTLSRQAFKQFIEDGK